MHYTNQYIYSRERRRFGRQCLFSDRTQLMLSIQPNATLRLNYILRNPVSKATQEGSVMAANHVLTENVVSVEHGMYHFEGGWPREININDEEQTLRYRKKIERDDLWGNQVPTLINTAIKMAAQNNAVDIYKEFFEDLPPDMCSNVRMPFEARQNNIFHDPVVPSRPIKILDWVANSQRFMALHSNYKGHHGDKGVSAIQLVTESDTRHTRASEGSHGFNRTSLEKEKDRDPGKVLLGALEEPDPISFNSFFMWECKNSLKPKVVFDSYEPVYTAMINPKDDNFLAGGFRNGKVAVWDTNKGEHPIRVCPLESAHREATTAICWVHSKSNTEFYTGSSDGSVKFWDGRDLSMPIHQILLDPEPTDHQLRERAHGVTVLEFEYTIPVRFIACSEHGCIFLGNRKGLLPTETLISHHKLFSGPIHTIERNPFMVKTFLVVGDWVACLWSEECKNAPTTVNIKKKNEMLCGCWSPTRCSLFVTGDAKGQLDFWDLLMEQRKPIFTVSMKSRVLDVKFRPDGEYVMAALENGDTHMLELDTALKHSGPKDRALLVSFLEREQHRSKLLEGRVEEVKLKHKSSNWAGESGQQVVTPNVAPIPSASKFDPEDPADFLNTIEEDAEYKSALRAFKEIVLRIARAQQQRPHIMEQTEFEKPATYRLSMEEEADTDLEY